MSEPFIGEIRAVGFNFAPVGWAFCDGSLQAIANNDALFALIGTTYGGDGQNTFALPNLTGRGALHQNSNFIIGQIAGTETVTLISQQIPNHQHLIPATSASGTATSPTSQVFAANNTIEQYESSAAGIAGPIMAIEGGNIGHENRVPFLAMNYIISLFGVFPSRN
jgi:microcystin-dependent protein